MERRRVALSIGAAVLASAAALTAITVASGAADDADDAMALILDDATAADATADNAADDAADPTPDDTPVTTATVTTTSTTTTTTTSTPPRRTARLVFTGDTLAHRGVVNQAAANAAGTDQAYDFGPMFDEVREIITDADIAICHLETPLSADNTGLSGYPTFNVPREMATALADAGYDGCTFASNHSLDRRTQGVIDSLTVLDEAGLKHAGAARDQAEYDQVTLYEADGITIANLSYSYGFNGFTEPADTPWLVNEIDVDEIAAEVERARDAGAEYVALSLHWGTEYRTAPDDYQLDIARQIADRDLVDVIIGHHAHVVQPVDRIGELPVVYGLGNFLSNQSANCCAVGSQDGVIVQVNIQDAPDGGFVTWLTYVPTWVDRSDYTIVLVGRVLDDAPVELSEAQVKTLANSRERTRAAIASLGNVAVAVED